MSYEPFLIEVDPDDSEYRETVVEDVKPYADGSAWSVTGEDGWSLGVPRLTHSRHGGDPLWISPTPYVGDTIRVYGSIGRPIRGVTLDGEVVFYRTPELQEQSRRRMVEDMHAAAARQLVIDRARMDANYEQLIPVFKARVDRFRAKDPNFRRDSEAYEVFCLLQAQTFAEHYRTQVASTPDPSDDHALALLLADRGESSSDFSGVWRRLEEAGVASKGHSNNTFGAALGLARELLAGTYTEEAAK